MKLFNAAVRFTVLTFVFIAAAISISGLTLAPKPTHQQAMDNPEVIEEISVKQPVPVLRPAATPDTLHAERVIIINNQESS